MPARYFLLNNRGAIAPGYLGRLCHYQQLPRTSISRWSISEGKLMLRRRPAAGVRRSRRSTRISCSRAHDTFHVATLTAGDFSDERPRAVIGMVPGEIVSVDGGYADHIDTAQDILKIAVIERHKNTHHIGLGYIRGYGLTSRRCCDLHQPRQRTTSSSSARIRRRIWPPLSNRIVENRGGITVMDGRRRCSSEVALPHRGHHVRLDSLDDGQQCRSRPRRTRRSRLGVEPRQSTRS